MELKQKILIIMGSIITIACVGFYFSLSNERELGEFNAVEVEDEVLYIELLDYVSDYNEEVQSIYLELEAGQVIAGIELTYDQSFEKKMILTGPDETSSFQNIDSLPSHHAYILVLVGDIVSYYQEEELVYQIENARVEYYCQTLLLESEYNSVYILSLDETKEKLVSLTEYVSTITDTQNYSSILQW